MTSQPTVAVPGTSLSLSRLGFGCARLFAGIEARASRRLVETALAVGIRHFDTAPSYSWGQSEQVLGDVLAGARDVTVATKVGIEAVGDGPSALGTAYRLIGRPVLARLPNLKARLLRRAGSPGAQAPTPAMPRTLSKAEIHASVERSLRRLRRHHLDVLLIHEPDQISLDQPTLEVFLSLQRAGVIAAFGLGYARSVSDHLSFGQVLQSQFVTPTPDHRTDILRIWHGILRGVASAADPDGTSAATRIRRILAQHPNDAVLFSASTSRQIRQVAGATDRV
jgi:aryl-alcohol dehydrogenase-like predicted oxidoreductase